MVDEGIDNFEAWRRIARGTAIRAAVAAGMTLTDIAQEFRLLPHVWTALGRGITAF